MIDRERLIATFLTLCRIDSPPKQEAMIARHLVGLLEGLGLGVVTDTAHEATGGSCGNIVATLPANVEGGTPIFFSAHMDTVEPCPDVSVVRDETTLRSDGASILGADDKAGIAPILEALKVLVDGDLPHGEVQVVISVSEEIGLLGGKYLDDSLLGATCGFVLDTGPPVGTIVTVAPTHDILDVVITGRAAHAGAEPEKGISAIQVAARAIDTMPLGRIDHETTANIGSISGGQATNIVCSQVTLKAEARSRDQEKLDAQVAAMEAALRTAAEAFGAAVDVRRSRAYSGYRHSDDALPVRIATQAAAAIGVPALYMGVGGGSDANFLNQRGRTAVVIGTAMRAVHTHSEHVVIDDLVKSAEWVLAIISEASHA